LPRAAVDIHLSASTEKDLKIKRTLSFKNDVRFINLEIFTNLVTFQPPSMANRVVIVVTLLWIALAGGAQNVKISVDNTEPRVGQEFTLTFEADFFSDLLHKAISDSIGFDTSDANKDLTSTMFARYKGPMTVGPFKFEFNGKQYWSNTVHLNVLEGLDGKKGVWLRKIKIDEKDYLLLEQIVLLTPIVTTSANTWNTEWKNKEENLAELIQKPKGEDIEFYETRSGMGGKPDKTRDYPPEVSYAYKFYQIKKGPKFKGPLKLTEKNFRKLPPGANVSPIEIN
jgi:BatD DUF11 like domain